MHRVPRLLIVVLAAALTAPVEASVADPLPTQPSAGFIQPGASIGNCTLNWVYLRHVTDRRHHRKVTAVYVGTAAHCVDRLGQRIDLWDNGVPGTPARRIGKVAYISEALDFALIAVDRANWKRVSPAMAGHPDIPTGVSTTRTSRLGDVVQFSGHGVATDAATQTQQGRQGWLQYNDGRQQKVAGVVSPGDSGGPVADVTDGNKALGIVTSGGFACCHDWPVPGASPHVGERGVALPGLLSDAAGHGFKVSLATVGTRIPK